MLWRVLCLSLTMDTSYANHCGKQRARSMVVENSTWYHSASLTYILQRQLISSLLFNLTYNMCLLNLRDLAADKFIRLNWHVASKNWNECSWVPYAWFLWQRYVLICVLSVCEEGFLRRPSHRKISASPQTANKRNTAVKLTW